MANPGDEPTASSWERIRDSGTSARHAWVTRDGRVLDDPNTLLAHLADRDGYGDEDPPIS